MERASTAMDGLLHVDPSAGEAPFDQVRHQLAEAIGDGRLAPGTKLPTIRGLADDLGLAVNTVARAYRELEAAGFVVTRRRLGTVVAPDAGRSGPGATSSDSGGIHPSLRLAAADYARSARASGLPETEAVALVRDAFRRLS